MRRLNWFGSVVPPKAENKGRANSLRDRLALLLAVATVVCLGLVFFLANGTQFLMPGPLASAHGAIENCGACHTKSGSGKLSWIHGLIAGDPIADSKACLTCHKMPDTALNAHSASAEVLEQITARLTKTAAETPMPQSARAQSIAFPTHEVVARGLYCATCHQEHQGGNFILNKISNEQCRSCHVVKFDSFDGHHPTFDNYPFKQRTHIIYDHAGHFGKHYPEVARKTPAKHIPTTCSTCHNSSGDKRIMAVAPFEQTCSACHLDQISGKERVSGPKGIAFLSLPGLDVQTLKKKDAAIGEWPDASDAALTPFMKVMISRNARGRALIKTVDSLNLQDLTNASDDQIKAVTNLVWEIKALFHALIAGKASDVLGDLNIGGGARLSATLVADLTASIPRDVVISAQQQWLPGLAKEMANRPSNGEQRNEEQRGWSPLVTEAETDSSASPREPSGRGALQAAPRTRSQAATEPEGPPSPEELSGSDAHQEAEKPSAAGEAARKAKLDPPPCLVRVLGQCLLFKGQEDGAAAAQPKDADGPEPAIAKPDGGRITSSTGERPRAMRAGLRDIAQAAEPQGASGKTGAADAKPQAGQQTPSADKQTEGKPADQTDDLLFPTEEELREIRARSKNAEKAVQPEGAVGKAHSANTGQAGSPASGSASSNEAAQIETRAASVISIESDVDPESWAEYGGWYRQDYAVFYRPTGHKDKFIYSWLFLTGPQAPKGNTSPAAAVFEFLISKDAQGSCTKCHSVDDIPGKGRVVNFSQSSADTKRESFTKFVHEPHFGIMDNRGCLTCHDIEKDRPYLKSYEQGNPQSFASNFGAVKKDLCQTCHNSSSARQDCVLCHKYHVNGVITPAMTTKLPMQ